jgi:hypothetical protein
MTYIEMELKREKNRLDNDVPKFLRNARFLETQKQQGRN